MVLFRSVERSAVGLVRDIVCKFKLIALVLSVEIELYIYSRTCGRLCRDIDLIRALLVLREAQDPQSAVILSACVSATFQVYACFAQYNEGVYHINRIDMDKRLILLQLASLN